MSKLKEVIVKIRSISGSSTVLSGIGNGTISGKSRAGRTEAIANSEGAGGGWLNKHVVDHSHNIYAYTTEVPTTTSVRNLCEDLTNVAKAAAEDIAISENNNQKIISAILQTSGFSESFFKLVNVLNDALAAEQSSHRRFEQLVQTLLAAQSEVKALYDTIDKAIEVATKTAKSGALGQIEDKGREIAHAIENQHGELQKQIESNKLKLSELTASLVAEMERKLAELCQDTVARAQKTVGEKIDEIGQAEIDTFSQSVSKVAEARAAELAERTTSAVQQLNVDLQAQIPALFRTTDAPSTFGARIKWLLLGKV